MAAAKKKIAKKESRPAGKSAAKPAAKKKVEKARPAAPARAKAPAKAPAKPAPRAAAKSAPAARAGGEFAPALLECLLPGLSRRETFERIAGLLHQHLGYSALNYYAPSGRAHKYRLAGVVTAEHARYWPAGEDEVAPEVAFAETALGPAVTDEKSAPPLYHFPAGLPSEADLKPETLKTDGKLSIITAPARQSDGKPALLLVIVLENPRPAYTRSDLRLAEEAAAALALDAIERERLREERKLRERLDQERAESRRLAADAAAAAAQRSELEAEASRLAAEAETRTKALEELEKREASLRSEKEAIIAAGLAREERLSALEEELAAERAARAAEIERIQQASATRADELNAQWQARLDAQLQAAATEREQLIAEREKQNREFESLLDSGLAEERERAEKERAAAEAALARREEELRSAHAAELERLSREREAAIAGVQAELETARAELNSFRSNLAGREKALQDEIAGLQLALEESDREKSARSEEKRKVEAELADLQRREAERAKALQSRDAELKTQADRVAAADAALAQEKSRVQTLEQSLADKVADLKRLEDALNSKDRELGSLSEKQNQELNRVRTELEQARRSLEQKENDYHAQTYELKQKVNNLTESLERQRSDAREAARKLSEDLELARMELADNESRSSAERAKLDAALQERAKELTDTRARIAQLEQNLAAEGASAQKLEAERARLSAELQTQADRAASLAAERDRKIAELQGQAREAEERLKRDIAGREQALAEHRTRIEQLETRIENLQRDLGNLRENKAQLEKELEEGKKRETRLRGELEARDNAIRGLTADNQQASEEIKNLKSQAAALNEEGDRLRADIGLRRERETRLEQAVASLKEDIHLRDNRINEELEKERELERRVAELKQNLAQLRAELQEMYQKEKRLQEEVSAAQARERGSKEEGRLLGALTHSIANLADLPEKLDFLRKNLPTDAPIERALIFSYYGEDALRFEDGFAGDERLNALHGLRALLKDTVFGQTLAALKPQVLKPAAGLDAPDLPPALQAALLDALGADALKTPARSFLALPLVEGQEAIGLVTLASSQENAFPDSVLRLLTSASPLFAVTLRYERRRAELDLHRSRIHHFRQVISYRDRRYLEAAGELQSLASRLRERVASGAVNGELGDPEFLRNIERSADEPLPQLFSDESRHLRFAEWIDNIGARAARGAGLSFEHDIELEALERLARRTGSGFRNLFWLAYEAIDNVVQHSQATKLFAGLRGAGNQIEFSIIDNGEGLIRTAGTETPARGEGLRAIRNLARAAGADIEFGRDEKGHGLAIHVRWNLADTELDETLKLDLESGD